MTTASAGEVAGRLVGLLAGLAQLAEELGYRWDGVRWLLPGEVSGLHVGLGQETGRVQGSPSRPPGSGERACSSLTRSAEL